MIEPSSRSLEFARKMVTYDPEKPRDLRVLGHLFVYESSSQAANAYELIVVAAAMFLEEYWLNTQVIAWDAAAAVKGEA